MGFAVAGRVVWSAAALVSLLFGSAEVPELYIRLGASIVAVGLALTAGRLGVAWSTGVGVAWGVLFVLLAVVRGYEPNPLNPFGSFFAVDLVSAVLGAIAVLLVWRGFVTQRTTAGS
jgi:hypothetical protein